MLYVLDEPSIGLHQRDNQRLIGTLTRLRDLGNTLIVVEHDEETIAAADWVVDIGPQAGEHGGRVVVSGTVEDLKKSPESITGAYLSGRTGIEVPATRRPRREGRELVVEGAREHNLRGIDVAFPRLLLAVTGVSGSGKSSLVNDIIYPALANHVNGTKLPRGRHTRITGNRPARKVVGVDQSPIGGAAVEPGDVHRRVRLHPRAVRRDDGGEGPRLPAGPVLLQREGRPVRELRG